MDRIPQRYAWKWHALYICPGVAGLVSLQQSLYMCHTVRAHISTRAPRESLTYVPSKRQARPSNEIVCRHRHRRSRPVPVFFWVGTTGVLGGWGGAGRPGPQPQLAPASFPLCHRHKLPAYTRGGGDNGPARTQKQLDLVRHLTHVPPAPSSATATLLTGRRPWGRLE